jgi:SAM-dependent methyltransferase
MTAGTSDVPTGNVRTGDVPTGNTYDKYGSTNPIEQRMMRGFLRALDGMLDGLSPRRVLEVGVGEGEVMARLRERFPEATMIGLDLPDHELASNWRRVDMACLFADGTALPFADDTFDLVLAIEVLEHVPGPDAALRELARVCSDRLIASVPFEPIWRAGNVVRRRYVRQLGNTPGHVNHWTRRGFGRFVGGRFGVEEVKSPLPWTMVRARVGA